MYDTQIVTELREIAEALHDQMSHETGKTATYLQGGRDMLLHVAKLHEQACPLAVLLFNSPIKVVDV